VGSTRLSNGGQPVAWAEHGLIDQSSELRCDLLMAFHGTVNNCRRGKS
jgi:hypothetical protein